MTLIKIRGIVKYIKIWKYIDMVYGDMKMKYIFTEDSITIKTFLMMAKY